MANKEKKELKNQALENQVAGLEEKITDIEAQIAIKRLNIDSKQRKISAPFSEMKQAYNKIRESLSSIANKKNTRNLILVAEIALGLLIVSLLPDAIKEISAHWAIIGSCVMLGLMAEVGYRAIDSTPPYQTLASDILEGLKTLGGSTPNLAIEILGTQTIILKQAKNRETRIKWLDIIATKLQEIEDKITEQLAPHQEELSKLKQELENIKQELAPLNRRLLSLNVQQSVATHDDTLTKQPQEQGNPVGPVLSRTNPKKY